MSLGKVVSKSISRSSALQSTRLLPITEAQGGFVQRKLGGLGTVGSSKYFQHTVPLGPFLMVGTIRLEIGNCLVGMLMCSVLLCCR